MVFQKKKSNHNCAIVCGTRRRQGVKETLRQGNRERARRCCYVTLAQLILFVVLGLFIATSACGKKGPPTLKAFEPPKSVTSLSVMRIGEPLTISWDYPLSDRKGLKGFILTRSSQDGEVERNLSPDTSEYTDSDIKVLETYRYRIRAVNKKGIVAEPSKEIEAIICPVPLPPTNVGFKVHNDTVELSWEPSKRDGQDLGRCGGPIRYNVYRTDTKSLVPINDSPLETSSFKVPVPTERPAYYTIRPIVNTGFAQIGPPSVAIVVNPADFVPSTPRIINTATNDGRVFIFWEESPERWVRGYRVYKKTSSGEFKPVSVVNTPVFTEQSSNEREVSYRVSSIGPVRESLPVEVKIIND